MEREMRVWAWVWVVGCWVGGRMDFGIDEGTFVWWLRFSQLTKRLGVHKRFGRWEVGHAG